MKLQILIVATSLLLYGCASPPQKTKPKGEWIWSNYPLYQQADNGEISEQEVDYRFTVDKSKCKIESLKVPVPSPSCYVVPAMDCGSGTFSSAVCRGWGPTTDCDYSSVDIALDAREDIYIACMGLTGWQRQWVPDGAKPIRPPSQKPPAKKWVFSTLEDEAFASSRPLGAKVKQNEIVVSFVCRDQDNYFMALGSPTIEPYVHFSGDFKVDSNEPITAPLYSEPGKPFGVSPNHGFTATLISQIAEGKSINVRVTGDNGQQSTADIPLAGAYNAIAKALKSCGILKEPED